MPENCSVTKSWLFATPWTVAHQTPLSMEFPRQEYWRGLPFPSPGNPPDPRSEPRRHGNPRICYFSLIHDDAVLFYITLPTDIANSFHIIVKVLVAQSCWTLCDPMDCSPPGSSVHGISQARILERVAISFSKESSLPRNWTQVSCSAGRFFSDWATSRGVKLKTGWPAQQFVTPQGVALFWFYPCPTDHLANVIVFFSTVRQEIISWR